MKTNGDVIEETFKPFKVCVHQYAVHVYMTETDFVKAEYQMNFDINWWNSLYSESGDQVEREERNMATTTTFNREDLLNILCNNTDEEIMQNYSLAELTEMFVSIYGKKRSGMTKRSIVSDFREMYYSVKRAEALCRPLDLY